MTDDSLDDVRWDYCARCDSYHDYKQPCFDSVGKVVVGLDKIKLPSVYEKEVWNAAIEAAAEKAEFEGCFVGTVKEIRKLRK